ncbi:energy transducer TonB family protein [Porphyromonas loveana]
MKGVTPVLDKEAVRMVKAMPKWIPAEYQGQKIATLVTQPVQFKLLGGDF